MKKILIIFISLLILMPSISLASDNIQSRGSLDSGNNQVEKEINSIYDNTKFFSGGSELGEAGVRNLLLVIGRDLKNIVFIIFVVIGIIIVIKLIFASNTEEEVKKLKTWLIWGTAGVMLMQISFVTYDILFDREINRALGRSFTKELVGPFIRLLQYLTIFAFIVIAIVAYYSIITANGEEEKIKKGRTTIIQAIIGVIIVKFSEVLVKNTFDPNCGDGGSIIIYNGTSVCENITDNAKIITSIINWANSFVILVSILMIIYAGFLVMTGAGDDEKQKKAKNIMIYVGVGILILFANYIILNFFIKPESII